MVVENVELSCFHVTTTREDDKNRQNTFFLCEKKMNLLPDEQLFVDVPFHPIKKRKKEICVVNEVQETIGEVYCPTCRNEKCVYLLPFNQRNIQFLRL